MAMATAAVTAMRRQGQLVDQMSARVRLTLPAKKAEKWASLSQILMEATSSSWVGVNEERMKMVVAQMATPSQAR